MDKISPCKASIFSLFGAPAGTSKRQSFDGTNRSGFRPKGPKYLTMFLVAALLVLPIVALVTAAHESSKQEQAALLTQNEEQKRTIDLQKQDIAALQTQVAQQESTISSQAKQIDSVKNGLQKERDDNPLWRIVLDTVIQFLVNMGCDWLKELLQH
jgi:hypothetical protein